MTLYTVGHSNRSLEELLAILRAHGVEHLVDIRHFPRSRTNAQFNIDVLPDALAAAGVAYTHVAALGGRRGKSKSVDPEINAGWEVQAFHNYADYALSDEFRRALDALLARAEHETCAIMCSEAVWWRCHRRIVTDHVIARGVPVVHLFTEQKAEPATLTPFARVAGPVTYPAVTSAKRTPSPPGARGHRTPSRSGR